MRVYICHTDDSTNKEVGFTTSATDIIACAKIEAEEIVTENSKRWPGFGENGEDMTIHLTSVTDVKHYADMENTTLQHIN